MCDGVVLHAAVGEDLPLDRVVGAQVAQVDERGADHVRPAAAPHAGHARLAKDFGRCIHHAVHPGLLPQQPSSALHLHLRLDQVRRRGDELREAARAHTRNHLLPHGEAVLVLTLKVLANL